MSVHAQLDGREKPATSLVPRADTERIVYNCVHVEMAPPAIMFPVDAIVPRVLKVCTAKTSALLDSLESTARRGAFAFMAATVIISPESVTARKDSPEIIASSIVWRASLEKAVRRNATAQTQFPAIRLRGIAGVIPAGRENPAMSFVRRDFTAKTAKKDVTAKMVPSVIR